MPLTFATALTEIRKYRVNDHKNKGATTSVSRERGRVDN